ncbi:MAG: RnfABCDGE type electron transport complex subunit D [Erysipelotrichaceae bacterium]|nr:RnfABCDGE type electron transport complex subunit D [Erysipelotrichaceae bacterium]
MKNLIVADAPHFHSHNSTNRIMLDVVIALLPATIASVVIFGTKALIIDIVCVLSAIAGEALFNVIAKQKQTIADFSAVVTGLLLALNISTNVEIWQCVVGGVFATLVVKCLFGGLGKNFANPAITARVFMLVAFSSVAGGAAPVCVDLVSSATPLELIKNGAELPSLKDMFLGLHAGAIGETCIVALVLGFIYLLVRRVIKWHTPVVFIGTVFVLYLIATGSFSTALYEILSGGLFLGAIFMATDYVTTPITDKGRVVFALGCAVITFIIRYFCAYPEGVSFSILIMNLLVPYIEKYTASTPIGGVKHEGY